MADTIARAAAKPTVTTQDAAATRRAKPAPPAAPLAAGPVGLLHNGGPAMLLSALVQPKVVIGAPNDPFEREADNAAEQIAAGGAVRQVSRLPAAGLASVSQRKQADEEEEPAQTLAVQRQADEEEEPAQMQASGFGGPSMRAAAATAIHSRGAGEPLRASVRAPLERGLGADLGEVRVHASASARGAAKSLHARAFTHRNHIWLGPGESQTDVRLMAHETTHVLQQDGIVRRKPADREAQEEEPQPVAGAAETVRRPPDALGANPRKESAAGFAVNGRPSATATAAAETGERSQPEAPAVELQPEEPDTAAEGQTDEAGQQPHPATAAQPGARPAEEEAEPQRSPSSPAEDPDFQKTLRKIKKTRKAQGSHPLPETKKAEVEAAAVLPEEEQATRNARSDHLATMETTAEATETKEESAPLFSPESFKELLKTNLAAIEKTLPQSEDAAEEFKRDKPLEGVKEDIGGQVAAENAKVTGPMAKEVKQEAPASEKPMEEPQELEEEKSGEKPKPISAAAAAPKPMLDSEVSMERESQSLDNKMAEEGITEEQLAESNEPHFVEALDTKRQAQQEAAAAPGRYREKEEKILAGAQRRARSAGQAGFGAMFESRSGAFSEVFSKQSGTEKADKAEQTRILGELERIYNGTKTDVDTILQQLSTDVDTTFETEAGSAKKAFEEQVEEKLDDIYGITVIDDWIFGEDTEAIEEVFREEKERFLTAMDGTLDRIAELIAAQLNAAIDRIKLGRKEAQDFYDGLSKEQQRLAGEAMEVYTAKYDTLEETVTAKQEELAQALAGSYKSNVDSLRESFDKIKEEISRGWIGKAIDFIVDVATAIKKLGELLLSIISRIANIIGDILAHPIRFLENLASGVVAGFQKFVGNLETYLVSGFFEWLRGSVGGAAIEVPTSFEPQGLFNLVTQILSLNYQTFRDLAVQKFGEPTVAVLEKGAELVEGGLELFGIARKDGLGGLWTHIKEMIASNVSEIFEQVKETVLYQTIEKVLTFVGSLFTPVGAFIKAVQTLYRGLRFLVDNIDRIAELVDAFLSSLELAVQGNVAAITDKVVLALRGFIVVAIDFLAKLVGLGNLGDKVRKILNALRQPIIRAMKWLLNKVSPLVNRIKKGVTAVADTGKAAVQKLMAWWNIRKRFKQNGHVHTLHFQGSRSSAVLMVSSETMPLKEYLRKQIASAPPDQLKILKLAEAKAELVEKVEVAEKTGTTDAAASDVKRGQTIARLLGEIAALLAQIKDERGLAGEIPDDVVAVPFNMHGVAHTMTGASRGGVLKITMASRDILIDSGLTNAITELQTMPDFRGRSKIVQRLARAQSLSDYNLIKGEWNTLTREQGRQLPQGVNTWETFLQYRLSQVIAEIQDLAVGSRPITALTQLFRQLNRNNGPYSHLVDPLDVAPFQTFSPTQRSVLIEENKSKPRNGNLIVSDESGVVLDDTLPATDPRKPNIDHMFARALGGSNSYSNAMVIARDENSAKRAKVTIAPGFGTPPAAASSVPGKSPVFRRRKPTP